MADETPPVLETKDLPSGYAPAPVPQPDVIGYEQQAESAPAKPEEEKPTRRTTGRVGKES